MLKFLYLSHQDWTLPWIEGGQIPIAQASKYLSEVRSGTQTPDENLVHAGPVSFDKLRASGIDFQGIRSLAFRDVRINDARIPDFTDAAYYKEDGLVLSFCHVFDRNIARRLQKVACVQIHDIRHLKEVIDAQLGAKAISGICRYTTFHQRSHFLKSAADSWQREYRLFWPRLTACTVILPPGIAVRVEL